MGRGRPKLDEGLVPKVLALIADGLSTRKACAQVGVDKSTFFEHIARPEYTDQYEKALAMRADELFDEIADISDNPDPEANVQRDRLRVDARKWVVSKMLPKKYGDKITQEITGSEGGPIGFKFVDPPPRPTDPE